MKSFNPHNEEFQEIIVRLFQKTASASDIETIRAWLSSETGNAKLLDEYRNIWMASLSHHSANDYNPDSAWKNFTEKINQTQTSKKVSIEKKLPLIFWKVAAIVLIAFSLGIGTVFIVSRYNRHYQTERYTQYNVPYGSKSQLILPDGSVVWINAGSILKYSDGFNISNREVMLEGEAYFDVSSNHKLPFMVKTYGVNIKVTGTAFNVKAYNDESAIETTVERGSVKIIHTQNDFIGKKEIILYPKQKVTITFKRSVNPDQTNINRSAHKQISESSSESDIKIDNNISTELFTSWKDKRWIIEKEELGNLAIKIGRRYDVSVLFESEAIKHYIFNGIIEEETLDQVMKIISLTSPITYKLNKKQLILNENKEFSNKPQ